MSESQEYRLAESLVWSNQDFSLAEFVEQYQLPQVVLVEVGYCGVNERTTFSSGQILTLHILRTTSKIVCQVPHSNAVLVPSSCELKAEVIPMDCSDTIVTAYQLSTLYQKIKYVRVMEVGSTWNNNTLDTLKINDILHIKKIETSNSVIRCKNLTTAQNVSILIDSTAVFVPLVDSKTYTLAEIEKHFGLPAKVRFLDKRAEMKLRSVPGPARSKPSTYLSDLGQMTAIEEIQDSDVIVTTVCSNLDEKVCLNVPTTLDIRLTVAEGFLHGDETYQKVVKTLDKQFHRTDLKAFEDLDVYQHMDAVKKTMKEMDKELPVEEASTEIVQRAREHMVKRAERKQSKKLMSFEKKPPKLQPRRQESAEEKSPPARPPKPGEKPVEKPKNFGKKLKSPGWFRSLGRKESGNKSPNDDEFQYEQPDRPDGVYASVDDLYEETWSQNSDSEDGENYTELDSNYVRRRPYEKPLKDPPKRKEELHHYHVAVETTEPPTTQQPPQTSSRPTIQNTALPPLPYTNQSTPQPTNPPPLPSSKPPQSQEDKQAIYQAISRFPQDLSGLSVADVSRLLRYLSMGSYVETFESELVDGEMLASMDQEELESLNVKPFHVKKMLRFIGGWRPNV